MSLPADLSKILPSILALPPGEFFKQCCDHEAGHYVMLHLVDLWFIPQFVCARTIRDEAGGIIAFGFDKNDFPLEKRILQAIAGMVAQGLGIFSRRPDLQPGDPEIAGINTHINDCAGSDLSDIKKEFGVNDATKESRAAQAMLRQNWYLVEAISQELSRGEILYSDEPRIIIEIAKGDTSRSPLLQAYRKHRVTDDDNVPEKFMEVFPDAPWYESVGDFHSRFTPATDCDCEVKCQIPTYDPYRYGGDGHKDLK